MVRDHSEYLGLDGRISEWILRNYGENVRTGFISLRLGIRGGPS